MVVELKKVHEKEKKREKNTKECVRQAANASYTCLKLLEMLAAPANMDASPVVAFTSVGPEAKIYITYKSKEDDEDEV